MTRTPDQEREALADLVESPGWAIFMEHMAEAWGHEACERALRAARTGDHAVSAEEWPFESTRILDTFAGMRANVRWPEERLKQLRESKTERVGLARWKRA